ncbi:hypothetical protein V2A60_007257 [Cordyceps javanica]
MRCTALLVAFATAAMALPTEDVAKRSLKTASAAEKSFCAANPDHFKCVNNIDF